jgi:hypothetical protein
MSDFIPTTLDQVPPAGWCAAETIDPALQRMYAAPFDTCERVAAMGALGLALEYVDRHYWTDGVGYGPNPEGASWGWRDLNNERNLSNLAWRALRRQASILVWSAPDLLDTGMMHGPQTAAQALATYYAEVTAYVVEFTLPDAIDLAFGMVEAPAGLVDERSPASADEIQTILSAMTHA